MVAVLSVVLIFKFEGAPPKLIQAQVPDLLGKKARLALVLADKKSGLREIKIYLVQKKHAVLLYHREFTVDPLWGSKVKEKSFQVEFEPLKQGFKDGEATLVVEARDASWRNRLHGNVFRAKKKVLLDLTSPRILVRSPLHYLLPGGSSLVLYQISEPVKKQGVLLNKLFFKGYPLKGHAGTYVALVALPVDQARVGRFIVMAQDKAGNVTEIPIPYFLRHKRYRHDRIRITDNFLRQKMPEFRDRYADMPQTDLLKAFIWVNTVLRQKNNEKISSLTKESTRPGFDLKGALLRLPHSATRALFGDQRTYYYHGQKIGFARHLGIDLASVAHAPVPAAAAGKVIYADYLGIYGNVIIIDHGYGLFSLYAHLAGFVVNVGDSVRRGQLIGYTDTTGLAGGDHLHFAVLVQGVFVEPQEWFDPQWVKNRILQRLKDIGP